MAPVNCGFNNCITLPPGRNPYLKILKLCELEACLFSDFPERIHERIITPDTFAFSFMLFSGKLQDNCCSRPCFISADYFAVNNLYFLLFRCFQYIINKEREVFLRYNFLLVSKLNNPFKQGFLLLF